MKKNTEKDFNFIVDGIIPRMILKTVAFAQQHRPESHLTNPVELSS